MFDALRPFFIFLPAFIKLLFLLFIILLIYNRKTIKDTFRKIDKKAWFLLILIVLTAFSLRFFWIPHEHTVFYDSYHVVASALAIQEDGIYASCEFVSDRPCSHHSFLSWPPAYPTLLSIVFSIFGSPESPEAVAFSVNALLGTTTVFLVFLLSYLWTKKEDIALICAFAFSMLPLFLKFSGGASLEIFSVFFLVLTLIFFEVFLKNKEKDIFLLFLVCLLCAAYVRAENIFMVPLFFFLFWIRGGVGFFWEKKNRAFFLFSFVCCLFFSIPALFFIHIAKNVISPEGWNPSVFESINYFLKHLPRNLYFFVNPLFSPVLLVFFGAVGTIFAFLKEKRVFLSFICFFFFYLSLYSSFDAGDFGYPRGNLGWGRDTIRYALILYIPLLYLFAKGMFYFLTNMGEKLKKVTVLAFMFIFIINSILTLPYVVFAKHPLNTISDLLISSKAKVPEDAYFVSQQPTVVRSVINKKVVAFFLFKDKNEYFEEKEVFLLKDEAWYNRTEKRSRLFIYENYDLEPIKTVMSDSLHEFGVYRLIKKQTPNI